MNIIIYTVLILAGLYFLLRFLTGVASKKISKGLRILLFLILAVFAVLLVGLGSGFYLIANLGPGPRDGLMTGIQKITNFPIAAVRAGIEITDVSIGWD